MSERGKALYSFLSSGSNNVVLTRPGTLYSIHTSGIGGGLVRLDDSHRFPQGVLNLHETATLSSNTVGVFTGTVEFKEGIGLNTGLVVAYTSNTAGVLVEYQ